HFIQMGRRMERALQTASLMRALLVPRYEDSQQEVLIEAARQCGEALIPYRRLYQSGINLYNGLEMLLLNGNNPRSLLYQLEQLEDHFSELPNTSGSLSAESKLLLEATTSLKLCQLNQLIGGEGGVRTDLDQLLARIHYLVSASAREI